MFETVTVEQAIKRGQRIVNFPIMFIMFGVIGFFLLLNNVFPLPIWMLAIAIPACIILPWLYWSYAITKWRIWAFENVRNVHELKKKAIEGNLMWPDGSFWEKTEIRSMDDKAKLVALEIKFDKPDIFSDDFAVPYETVVKYSKSKGYTSMVFGLAFAALGLYLVEIKSYLGGGLGIIMGAYISYTGIKHVFNNTAQIIINDKGIETFRTPFQPWSNIENEGIIKEGNGKSTRYYFTFDYMGNGEKVLIGDYDIRKEKLENLLHIYRLRSSKRGISEQNI